MAEGTVRAALYPRVSGDGRTWISPPQLRTLWEFARRNGYLEVGN